MKYKMGEALFLSDTRMFILVISSIAILVLETTVARLYIFLTPGPQSLYLNLVFFSVGIVTYLVSHVLIFVDLRNRLENLFDMKKHFMKYIYSFVTVVQTALSALLVIVFWDVIVYSSYKTNLIIAIVSISYISGIINLAILTERFSVWIRQNRTLISVLFALSTISILINNLVTLSFVVGVLLTQPHDIGWHLGILSPSSTEVYNILKPIYSMSFIISYTICWLSTVVVLHNYSHKLGKTKFYLLVALPLLYIVGEFQNIFLPLLSEYRTIDPVNFTLIYTLVFSIFKISGSFFFGVGFWSMARKMQQQRTLKSFLNISAYGLILVFVTNQAILLLNTLYPPLGLMASCFLGLSSFLLLIGTYSAAVSVSNDKTIRNAIRSSVEKESKFVGDIGSAELTAQIKTRVSLMMVKLSSNLEKETDIESSMTVEDIRNYTNLVVEKVFGGKNKS